jgi:tRNA-splicing ligase RtcB (3'-phosphate/5'-hydroxy nucleic acid ligase)
MSFRIINYHAMKVPLKIWDDGVIMEPQVITQMINTCMLPCIRGAALMPDGHFGRGAAIGAVTATIKAIVPAITGVDIGCGMIAVRTSLTTSMLPDNANKLLEDHIEAAVPVGSGEKGKDTGKWKKVPKYVENAWAQLLPGYEQVVRRHGRSEMAPAQAQLGTLGGGNHFIEICLDENQNVWIMLHSGSRGIGNKIGTHFIDVAKKDMEQVDISLPNKDLSYLREGTEHFDEYVRAVIWCQEYARINRELMLRTVMDAIRKSGLPRFTLEEEAVNCHHNYVQLEDHFGERVWITRKGAVSAREGELGIIPGSMGDKSYIVRGKGNPNSFNSCSHGAGRCLPRGEAKRTITIERHKERTRGVACRVDKDVVDESPDAYKPIDDVMAAQSDLVDIVHTLKQITCIKG